MRSRWAPASEPPIIARSSSHTSLRNCQLASSPSEGRGQSTVARSSAITMSRSVSKAGVPRSAILLDPAGISTEATVANVSALLAGRNGGTAPGQLIAVSQAYHLPRVQLAFGNAGIDVLTVPAADPEPIGEMPLLVAREVLAFWAYYGRVCLG